MQSWHLSKIEIQDSQAGTIPDNEEAKALSYLDSYTLFVDDKIVCCAGIIPIWTGRYMLWSSISKNIGSSGMVILTKVGRRFLNTISGRIEAYVIDGHDSGHRYMKMLGFHLETPNKMEMVMPNGSAGYLYARIN